MDKQWVIWNPMDKWTDMQSTVIWLGILRACLGQVVFRASASNNCKITLALGIFANENVLVKARNNWLYINMIWEKECYVSHDLGKGVLNTACRHPSMLQFTILIMPWLFKPVSVWWQTAWTVHAIHLIFVPQSCREILNKFTSAVKRTIKLESAML